MKPRTIVFAGTPDFAVPSLQKLIADPAFDVVGVITPPDKPAGRKKEIIPCPVKVCAEEDGIPVWQPEKINEEWDNRPTPYALHPTFLVVVSYGKILSQDILDSPTIAAVNLHPSLLPRWRGPSPVPATILAGDEQAGITLQTMTKEMDAGDILAQIAIPLDGTETSPELLDRLMGDLGSQLLVDTLKEELNPKPQDASGVTISKMLSRDDGNVDSETMTATRIDRHVRALLPWPGVTMEIEGEELKILETSLSERSESMPIKCRDGSMLHIVKLQPSGKKPMSGADWKRGRK